MPARRCISLASRDLLTMYSVGSGDRDAVAGRWSADPAIGCLGMAQSYAGDDLQARTELRRAEAANPDVRPRRYGTSNRLTRLYRATVLLKSAG